MEAAQNLFNSMFFDSDRYDFSAVGRVTLNARLGLGADDTVRVLRVEDIFAVVMSLAALKDEIVSANV